VLPELFSTACDRSGAAANKGGVAWEVKKTVMSFPAPGADIVDVMRSVTAADTMVVSPQDPPVDSEWVEAGSKRGQKKKQQTLLEKVEPQVRCCCCDTRHALTR
jgi:hypothetical protein